ncbi:MAG: DinB family protein [Acidobacteriales bacterium]|nr:DinB family protein [Terriglobales bacterium]
MDPALRLSELLAYTEGETRKWRDWFARNPAALDVKLDIAQATDARTLVQHIVIVDLRYAERLLGEEVTAYENVTTDAVTLFATADRAFQKLRSFLSSATEDDWKFVMEFPTPSAGTLKSSKRKMFVHTLLHSARHWAQLATALRTAGFKTDWQHDFLMTDAID